MFRRHLVISAGLAIAFTTLIVGCGEKPKTPAKADAGKSGAAAKAGASESAEAKEIRETLAKLEDTDRKLAEAQGVCPVSDEPLGSMGVPPKMKVKDRDVFICCAGCEKAVEKDPDAILAKLDAKKAK